MIKKLFAVYLGGRAPKANIELHDVVFAVGETIEATYEQLMDKWFGTPKGLHLDSWMELDIVDGYKITLSDWKSTGNLKLYFINLGAYLSGQFMEAHANTFLVAANFQEAKVKGKALLAKALPLPAHTDDLHDIDDCLELSSVGSSYINLEKTEQPQRLKPVNGYHLVPKDIVQDYMKRKPAKII